MADYVLHINGRTVTAYEKKSYIIEGVELSEKDFLTLYKGLNEKGASQRDTASLS